MLENELLDYVQLKDIGVVENVGNQIPSMCLFLYS